MKLPNLEQARIDDEKITGYLLSDTNSKGKAKFFTMFGFDPETWEALRQALLRHAHEHEVSAISETVHGIKVIIEGEMLTPSGRSPQIRAVWIIDHGRTSPRLVTAYPLEGESDA